MVLLQVSAACNAHWQFRIPRNVQSAFTAILCLASVDCVTTRLRTFDKYGSVLSTMQVLVCLVIGAAANVLKTLAAKLLAASFHRQAHFDKMQDALSKVQRCMILCPQPLGQSSIPAVCAELERPVGARSHLDHLSPWPDAAVGQLQ